MTTEAEKRAEEAYPSAPFYITGRVPWPQSFRDVYIEGWNAALESRQGLDSPPPAW